MNRHFIALQDDKGGRRGAEFLAHNALLHEVEGSFRVHDLLLDFIKLECRNRQDLVEDAVRRQTQFLGRLAVVRSFGQNEGMSTNLYALISLWRSLEDLSSNKQLDVQTYEASLGELGEAESTDVAYMYALIAWLFLLKVSTFSPGASTCQQMKRGNASEDHLKALSNFNNPKIDLSHNRSSQSL